MLGNEEYDGNIFDMHVMITHRATVTTHWNQVTNIGASNLLLWVPSDCPLSKALLMNTNEIDITLQEREKNVRETSNMRI